MSSDSNRTIAPISPLENPRVADREALAQLSVTGLAEIVFQLQANLEDLQSRVAALEARKGAKSSKKRCPLCQSSQVSRSHRRGFVERLLSVLGYYPYQCENCEIRFFHRSRQRK